ncbi:adaptor protein MecA [Treponema sp. R6D11]
MTIQKISSTKLYVTLSRNDIESLKISKDCLTYNSPEAQMLIGDIITAAKAQVEFEPVGENIIVEASSDDGEGINFSLTVISDNVKDEKPESVMSVFRLNTQKNLIAACLHFDKNYTGESYLFKLKGVYYIALRTKLLPKHVGYDYGEIIDNSDNFFSYLKENGDVLVAGDLFENDRIHNRRIA